MFFMVIVFNIVNEEDDQFVPFWLTKGDCHLRLVLHRHVVAFGTSFGSAILSPFRNNYLYVLKQSNYSAILAML